MLNSRVEELFLPADQTMVRIQFPDSICGIKKTPRLLGIWIFLNVDRFGHLIKHDGTSVKALFIIFPKKFAF